VTAQLTLSIGTLTRRPEAAALASHLARNIGALFYMASGKDIQLQVIDRGPVAAGAAGADGAMFSDSLHQALHAMTGNSLGSSRVSHIGLLIADSYQPAPDFFGLMFDDAFSPGGTDPWALTPREGCAVFLRGIEAKRSPAERMEEAIFTALHELGHVFNLQHSRPPSFMARSAVTGPVDLRAAGFAPFERELLSCCSTSRFIWPGGSRFGDLGNLAQVAGSPDPSNRPVLDLRISASQNSFWVFEPVELDVCLSAITSRVVRVPDALDAGYTDFEVWIEQPDGERRKLRYPRHYCNPRGTLHLRAGESFERDISIFGQSGGHTFVHTGAHRVWCEFTYAPGQRIVSNVLELDVRPRDPTSEFWTDAVGLLTDRHAAQLLYYRRLNQGRARRVVALQHFGQAYSRHPVSAMVHYALGRAFAQAALGLRRNEEAARQARRHLKAAARRRQLGEHRMRRAEETLAQLR
jgi:hypothetical protein